MNLTELSAQLSGKKRRIDDIVRYIGTRTDQNPNYALLLGAGCSVTSGVRSAYGLVQAWRRETYAELGGTNETASAEEMVEYLRLNGNAWFDPTNEYSSLFERRFDLQRQRRMFVESEVAGKTPSIGYAYLTSLIGQGYFNTVFTTNFDDLLNEAFYLYSDERPIVCAHDSSINSVTVTSKRPKIIKLHGDYLFDDLKSTLRETESLEQNMRTKLSEFSKDFGLIVVGYSGADRSIMDNLHALLKNEEYLKSGIYWCLRKGADVSEDLRKLLFRDRVYFVEVEGFDELFAELYAKFNDGEVLPPSMIRSNRHPNDAIKRSHGTGLAIPETTDVLRRAKQKLARHSKRSAIATFIAGHSDDDRASIGGRSMTDDDLLLLSEISELLNGDQHDVALARIADALPLADTPRTKERLLQLAIDAHVRKGDHAAAAATADQLINLHPKEAGGYLRKARITMHEGERLVEIDRAITADPCAVMPYVNRGRLFAKRAKRSFGAERSAHFQSARSALERALLHDPSLSNPAWDELFELISSCEFDKQSRNESLERLLEKAKEQNPISLRTLTLAHIYANRRDNTNKTAELEQILPKIDEAQERYPDSDLSYSKLKLRVLQDLKSDEEIRTEIRRLNASGTIDRDVDLASLVGSIMRVRFGEDDEAIALLRNALRSADFDIDVYTELFTALVETGRLDEAEAVMKRWSNRIGRTVRSVQNMELLAARGRFDECLKEAVLHEDATGIKNVNDIAYYSLCARNHKVAEDTLKAFLTGVNFTPEASVQVVNYELARKMAGHKVNRERLLNVSAQASDHGTKAAVHALLDEKQEVIKELRAAIAEDRTFRFRAARWPVLAQIVVDAEVKKVLQIA